MGKAIYCDRCGKLFNNKEIEVKRGEITGFYNEDLVADLCPECLTCVEECFYGDDIKKKVK